MVCQQVRDMLKSKVAITPIGEENDFKCCGFRKKSCV
jgi:hypothetical protein